jgi:uncharacterized protein YlxW (UPF0749 family)
MREQLARPNLTLALMALVVGLALAWQLKGPRASPPVGYAPGDPRDRTVHAIEQLEAEQSALKAQIARLRADLSTYQSQAAAETDRLQRLNAELDAQMAAAGLTAAHGPGVAVTLDDSTMRNAPPSSDPNALLIHEYDLRDVINVLWLAGAEAISINDERVVGNTSVYCVGSTVMVNTTRLSPPYIVRAIGEPAVLAETLRNPAYLTTLRRKAEREGITFKVAKVSKMTLPAYTGGFSVRHSNVP